MPLETVPLPSEKFNNKEPVHLEVSGLEAWPRHRFSIYFDWNGELGRWIIRIVHDNTNTEFAHAPACLYREYGMEGYVDFMFFDPSRQADAITSDNLGENVKLGVFRGEKVVDE